MKILIHTNAPWVPSGYGRQCALLIPLLEELGHEVIVSAISGLDGDMITWNGTQVLPHGKLAFGIDTLLGHAQATAADLVLTLMDTYRLLPIAHELRELNLACWMPIDTVTLGRPDAEFLKRSGATPIAMSHHGQQALAKAGWENCPYLPHMHDVDRETYEKAQAEREEGRTASGVAGRFVIGIAAANHDQFRKGFPEQLEAFRRFHQDYPDSALRVHTLASGAGSGANLLQLAKGLGLDESAVEFSDHYAQVSGIFDDQMMNDWYSQLDVLSNCSYGEGFGVTMLEAQAMGTPVVATRCSAMRDPFRAQWLVDGEPFWNYVHESWWIRPSIQGIVKAYVKAYRYAGTKRAMVRDAARHYHRDEQAAEWDPVLKDLEPRA
jgi:glycosyltransferase involved in cell wall biosynthesis